MRLRLLTIALHFIRVDSLLYISQLKRLYIPNIEENNRFIVSRSDHNSIMTPVDIEDHPTRLLRAFESFDHLLVLQRPNKKLVLNAARRQHLVVRIKGQT